MCYDLPDKYIISGVCMPKVGFFKDPYIQRSESFDDPYDYRLWYAMRSIRIFHAYRAAKKANFDQRSLGKLADVIATDWFDSDFHRTYQSSELGSRPIKRLVLNIVRLKLKPTCPAGPSGGAAELESSVGNILLELQKQDISFEKTLQSGGASDLLPVCLVGILEELIDSCPARCNLTWLRVSIPINNNLMQSQEDKTDFIVTVAGLYAYKILFLDGENGLEQYFGLEKLFEALRPSGFVSSEFPGCFTSFIFNTLGANYDHIKSLIAAHKQCSDSLAYRAASLLGIRSTPTNKIAFFCQLIQISQPESARKIQDQAAAVAKAARAPARVKQVAERAVLIRAAAAERAKAARAAERAAARAAESERPQCIEMSLFPGNDSAKVLGSADAYTPAQEKQAPH